MGGPIRLVDARCKDAKPLVSRAQDNMLHLDGSPFKDEFKILLMWEKGKVSGPKGQNLVFLPGTQKGVRNCGWSSENGAYATENGSVFASADSIRRVFEFQKRVIGVCAPLVVEVQDKDRPLTTLFAAGSLVHHRYRTADGCTRSAITITFHSRSEHQARFTDDSIKPNQELGQLILDEQEGTHVQDFLNTLFEKARLIGAKIVEITSRSGGTKTIDQELLQLSPGQVRKWFTTVAFGPEIDDIKLRLRLTSAGMKLSVEALLGVLVRDFIFYDKHGPLDLIFYADSREEDRKWARKRFREIGKLISWKADCSNGELP